MKCVMISKEIDIDKILFVISTAFVFVLGRKH